MNEYLTFPLIITKIHHSMKGFTKPGKYHYKNRNCYELGFRVFGDTISSAQGKSFIVRKGCVVFKPKGVEDDCETNTGVEYCSCCFDLENNPNLNFHVFQPDNPDILLEKFKNLIKEEQSNGINLKCFSILYEILHLLNNSKTYSSSKNNDLLQDCIQYIESNYKNSDFNVSNIVEHFEISPSFLRKLFHQKLAKSPVKYIIEKRIEYAKKLLLFSHHTISEISESAGFESQFYFSRLFKKYTSLSPRQFRDEYC